MKGANKKKLKRKVRAKDGGRESPEKAEQMGLDLSRSLKQKDFI